jgi:EAL domain-containing protein (putative c-di-GMP-specific phosphodiesterase class I)
VGIDALVECGCDEAQGYNVAPPLSTPEFARWVRNNVSRAGIV